MNYSIVVDWMQVMFACEEILPCPQDVGSFLNGNVCLTPSLVQGNKFFEHSWELSIDGEAFGYLLSHSRTPLIPAHVVQLKIYNHHLYRSGWLSRLRSLCTTMGWEYKNVSRLDIAIDGVYDSIVNAKTGELVCADGVRSFLQKEYVAEHRYVMMGKAALSASSLNPKTGLFSGFYIGKCSSDKILSVYDKSQELEQSNKNYIREFWAQSGLPVESGRIERIELRMRSACIRSIEGFDVWRLEDSSYLASIARTQFQNWFEFVPVSDDGNKSRARAKFGSISIIDWDSVGGRLLEKKTVSPSRVQHCKVVVKSLYRMAVSQDITVGSAVASITPYLAQGQLWEWYEIKRKQWGVLPSIDDGSFLDDADNIVPVASEFDTNRLNAIFENNPYLNTPPDYENSIYVF